MVRLRPVWIGLSMVLRLRQHNIGYTADGICKLNADADAAAVQWFLTNEA